MHDKSIVKRHTQIARMAFGELHYHRSMHSAEDELR